MGTQRGLFPEFVAWLDGRPAGELIAWRADSLSAHVPASRQVDVYCAPLCDELGLNWAWEFWPEGWPDYEEGEDRTVLVRRLDARVVVHADGHAELLYDKLGLPAQSLLLGPRDRAYFDRLRLPAEAFLFGERERAMFAKLGTADVDGALHCPMFSAAFVSQELEHWAAEHAGRGDLSFAFDPGGPDPPLLKLAAQRLAQQDGLGEVAPGFMLTSMAGALPIERPLGGHGAPTSDVGVMIAPRGHHLRVSLRLRRSSEDQCK